MKLIFTLLASIASVSLLQAQSPITAVTTTPVTTATPTTYVIGSNTYNWGVAPNNTTVMLDGFTASGLNFNPVPALSGTLYLRRVNNAGTTGDFALEWSEGTLVGSTINLNVAFDNNMQTYLNSRAYNKGADNIFDNVTPNSNNIERLDYVVQAGYASAIPAETGIGIFDRGDVGGHDPVVIAAITGVDGSGNPTSYGNPLRVAGASFGDAGPNVAFRIVKGASSGNLAEVGSNTQSRGGVFVSLTDLGIAANQTVYGYSLMANDLPSGITAANLVDYTNGTYFPTNTGSSGGIDLAAVVGFFATSTVLPTRFTLFNATSFNSSVNLQWSVENDNTVERYDIQRSENGVDFANVQTVTGSNSSSGNKSYTISDDVSSITSEIIYYRIKMIDKDGTLSYSKVVSVKVAGFKGAFTMFPNPVISDLFINMRYNAIGQANVSVINTNGQKVLSQSEKLANGVNSFSVEGVSKLPRGTYFLNVYLDSGKRIIRKFHKD